MTNLFSVSEPLPAPEVFETLIPDKGILIERIISIGHSSPPDFWFDQGRDEWVCLLQGRAVIEWADGRRRELVAGDWLLIPAHERHRVASTSAEPPCIWLAVHGNLK